MWCVLSPNGASERPNPEPGLAVFATNLTDARDTLLQLQIKGASTANRNNQPLTIGANLIYRW